MNARDRLGTMATGVGLAVAVLWGSSRFEEVDAWWQLRVGEHLLRTFSLYGTDPWATFAARPYTATQWLPEMVAAFAVDHLGMGALVFLRSAALVALFVALYALCRHRAGPFPAALTATLALLGSGAGLNPRPQLVSFVLFAVVALAWLRTMDDGRPRWWLPLVFWLWGCCHSLWMFGLLVGLVLSVAGQFRREGPRPRWRDLLVLNALCVAALAVTPLGPRLLVTPLTVAGNASWIAEEWKATPFNNAFAVIAVGMSVATALLWVRRPARREVWQVALLALGLLLTLWMWRLVPLGCALTAPLLASALHERLQDAAPEPGRWDPGERRRTVVAAALALLLAGALSARPAAAQAQTYPGRIPQVDAAMAALPDGTVVYNDFGISGWLLWTHPRLRPVVDLRVEIYSAPYLRSYVRAERVEPGWEQYVEGTGAHVALLEVSSPLGDALQERLGWTVVARQGRFEVLRAPSAGTGPSAGTTPTTAATG